MTKLFDLENGNWENSEVMRIFAEAFDAALCNDDKEPQALEPSEISKEPDGTVTVELEPKDDDSHQAQLEMARAECDLWRAREALVRLAGDAVKSGNIKAAYLIEKTLTDLDSDSAELSIFYNKKQDSTNGGQQ